MLMRLALVFVRAGSLMATGGQRNPALQAHKQHNAPRFSNDQADGGHTPPCTPKKLRLNHSKEPSKQPALFFPSPAARSVLLAGAVSAASRRVSVRGV